MNINKKKKTQNYMYFKAISKRDVYFKGEFGLKT